MCTVLLESYRIGAESILMDIARIGGGVAFGLWLHSFSQLCGRSYVAWRQKCRAQHAHRSLAEEDPNWNPML